MSPEKRRRKFFQSSVMLSDHKLGSEILDLPNDKQNEGHDTEHILVRIMPRFHTGLSRKLVALCPPKLRTKQQNKPQEETSHETSDVCKIVNMRKNSNSQVNGNNDHKSQQSCSLQDKESNKIVIRNLPLLFSFLIQSPQLFYFHFSSLAHQLQNSNSFTLNILQVPKIRGLRFLGQVALDSRNNN